MTVPGLPSTRVVHPRFEQHHRPVSEGAMTTTGRLLRLDETGVRDPASGKTTFAEPRQIYQGPARLKANSTVTLTRPGGVTVQADRPVTVGGYLLVLPADCPPPLVRDVWQVDGCDGDPSLPGVRLRIVDVPRNGLSWQRNVGCDIEQPTNRAGGVSDDIAE